MHVPKRKNVIELRPMPADEFLVLLFRHSSTAETGARIKSQFEKDLKGGDPDVGVLGLYLGDRLAGGISFAHRTLRYRPEFSSARLDTVLTLPDFRGMGLGTLMMTGLFQHSIEQLGDRLVHYSTIALHPIVERLVTELEFVGLNNSDAPLFTLDLEEDGVREKFDAEVRRIHYACMQKVQRLGFRNSDDDQSTRRSA